jgi:hypothetical protein
VPDEEELRVLDAKLKQLKLDYDRYFLGSRPREPVVLRGEVEKLVALYSNQATPNIALRFRFSSLCSRFQAHKRTWSETQRQIEQGVYARHRFRAQLHERDREVESAGVSAPSQAAAPAAAARPRAGAADPAPPPSPDSLYAEYRAARRRCGQDDSVTPAALERVLAQQREQLRAKFGAAEFRFRVVVEEGRAKIKASRVA